MAMKQHLDNDLHHRIEIRLHKYLFKNFFDFTKMKPRCYNITGRYICK